MAPVGHLLPQGAITAADAAACIRTKSPVKTRPQPRVNKASPVRAMGTCRFFQQMNEGVVSSSCGNPCQNGIYDIPRTQMTLVLLEKGLLLEGSTPKIEDKQVPGNIVCVYMVITCNYM